MIPMLRFAAIAVALVCGLVPAGAQSSSSSFAILSVTYTDAQHVWVLGLPCADQPTCSRLVVRGSADGGHTWPVRHPVTALPSFLGKGQSQPYVGKLQYATPHDAYAFGPALVTSHDGGKTWAPVGNKFAYEGEPGTHLWYDGTPRPFEFKRIWHLEPSLDDPDTIYAGVEDAALFRSIDGGQTWQELPGLRRHVSGPSWQPGAGGMCLHTIILDPKNPKRIFVAISAAGAFRTDDGLSLIHI